MKTDISNNLESKAIQKIENRLIKDCLKGKKEAFASLISPYKKRIEVLGMSFFHNTSDVEDFMQEVYIKAYTKLSTFRGESKFSTWLTRIAYTTAINSKKKQKDFESFADEENLYSDLQTPEEMEIRRITCEAVKEALTELPEKFKVCLDLYFFYDYSYDEIAIITDFPVNTIKSHVFRAKQILREKLKDFNE